MKGESGIWDLESQGIWNLESGIARALRASRLSMTEADFGDFYARTSAPLMRYLRRLTGSASVAEDLLQDAFLRLLSQPRVPSDPDHLRNYAFKIATNLARDRFRRRKFAEHPIADAQAVVDRTSVTSRHDAGREPSDVWAALRRVTPRDRELLLLAYVEGMTHQEISQVTGLMRTSLKPLLFRARRRFETALVEMGLAPGQSPEAVS